jgi:hypothetical protein
VKAAEADILKIVHELVSYVLAILVFFRLYVKQLTRDTSGMSLFSGVPYSKVIL